MPVGLSAPESLAAVSGVRVATAALGGRSTPRDDLTLFELADGASCAATFTRNAFCAAPVTVAREHLGRAAPRYLLVNAGNANAGTGERGIEDAKRCCGIVARATLGHGGEVTGVIPRFLMELELSHPDLSELVVVDDMHTRKRVMFERADAFVVLPGGLGTLDEAMEIITWRQLARHDKPVIALNVAGYWEALRAVVDNVVRHGFADPDASGLFSVVETVEDLFSAIEAQGGGNGARPALRTG